jgi:vacuolar-type H+-ATPase subunit F/Vma7
MKTTLFMTTEDARFGFSLTGVKQLAIKPEHTAAQLQRALADRDLGVLVIDERLLVALPRGLFDRLEKEWHGLIVTLPAPASVATAEDPLQRLIRRALGYHVRLQL